MKPHFDYTGTTDFEGLSPNTVYQYRVGYTIADMELAELQAVLDAKNTVLDWDQGQWIETRTAQGANGNISFVFGSCRYLSRLQLADKRGDKTFRSILEDMPSAPLDLFLMVGDQIYADDFSVLDPDSRLEEFWGKYRDAYKQPYFRELMSRVPTYMVLDDHEILNNWHKDMLDKCENDEEHKLCRLFVSAMQAYHSYQLVHGPGFDPSPGPREVNTPRKLWYHFDCGRAKFFVLDTRTERSPRAREMVSKAQLKALRDWMLANKSAVKFVVSAVPFFPDPKHGIDDKWGGFVGQRDSIISDIVDNNVTRVTFISGDIHASGYATMVDESKPDNPIHQIISSPFWWPLSPGDDAYFNTRKPATQLPGSLKITRAKYFTDDDNYVRVSTTGNGLKVECRGRKRKKLGDATLSF
jgi:alkaline phosphatase D